MAKKEGQEYQTILIPGTGRRIEAKKLSGKELFWREDDEKDEQYAKLWEDDRI